MSEKRFVCIDVDYGDDWYITDNGKRLSEMEIVDCLNEQQATISQLEEENKKLSEEWEFSFRTELAHHRVAEKELQEKIREQQATINKLKEEEKLYAQEILRLNELLKQYQSFKDLGGDY